MKISETSGFKLIKSLLHFLAVVMVIIAIYPILLKLRDLFESEINEF